MTTQVEKDVCLQCGEHRETIRHEGFFCVIMEGYEYREVVAEWDRHHFRDWSSAELRRMGVKPEAFEKHRRSFVTHLLPCEDLVRGHLPAKATATYDGHVIQRKGDCVACGKSAEDIAKEAA